MTEKRLDDSAVVRRIKSNTTHVADIGQVWRARMLGADYWAITGGARARCGVRLEATSVIMQTGTTVRCRACVHLTGLTKQSPAVHEKLDAFL